MEVESLGAAPDRVEQLVWLGCREDEHDVFRRFFECLEKRIPSGTGQHVGLIQDVDAAGALCGGDRPDVDSDLPDVFDLVVRRRIEFDDVE